jgi:hypothetical protein
MTLKCSESVAERRAIVALTTALAMARAEAVSGFQRPPHQSTLPRPSVGCCMGWGEGRRCRRPKRGARNKTAAEILLAGRHLAARRPAARLPGEAVPEALAQEERRTPNLAPRHPVVRYAVARWKLAVCECTPHDPVTRCEALACARTGLFGLTPDRLPARAVATGYLCPSCRCPSCRWWHTEMRPPSFGAVLSRAWVRSRVCVGLAMNDGESAF